MVPGSTTDIWFFCRLQQGCRNRLGMWFAMVYRYLVLPKMPRGIQREATCLKRRKKRHDRWQRVSATIAISVRKHWKLNHLEFQITTSKLGEHGKNGSMTLKKKNTFAEITDGKDKMSALKIYEDLKGKLNNHFLSMKNKHHAWFTFSKQRPESGWEHCELSAWLPQRAKDCELNN